MVPAQAFFPFHPRALRRVLAACAMGCAVLSAFTLSRVHPGRDLVGLLRGGATLGLMLAFAVVFMRLRARDGWGVLVEPLTLTVARPLSGDPIRIPWTEVSMARCDGKGRRTLTVLLKPGGRVLVPSQLFASREEFEAMVAAVQERAGPLPV